MKLTIFRTPKHARFNYAPRYYDPVKEEIEEKLKSAKAANDGNVPNYRASISAAFRRKTKKKDNSSAIQLLLAAAMLGLFVAWLFYGNDVFYAFLILVPVYFYFRLKSGRRSN